MNIREFKGLQLGDIVRDECGNIGKVTAIYSNNVDNPDLKLCEVSFNIDTNIFMESPADLELHSRIYTLQLTPTQFKFLCEILDTYISAFPILAKLKLAKTLRTILRTAEK